MGHFLFPRPLASAPTLTYAVLARIFQVERELAFLKIRLDEAQERHDICLNQWQDIKNDVDDIKRRKAHQRVFGSSLSTLLPFLKVYETSCP